MADQVDRELEVKLYNRDQTMHLQISPMNTIQQIVQILVEDDFLEQDIDFKTLRFKDQTGQQLHLGNQTRNIKPSQGIFKLYITKKTEIKDELQQKSAFAKKDQKEHSQIFPIMEKSKFKISNVQQNINQNHVDQDFIFQAIQASCKGEEDVLRNINEANMITNRIYAELCQVIQIVQNKSKVNSKIKQFNDQILFLQNQLVSRQNEIAKFKEENNKLRDSSKVNDTGVRKIDMQKEKFRKNNSELMQKVGELQQKLKQSQLALNSNMNKSSQMKDLQAKLDWYLIKQTALNNQITNLKAQLSKKHATIVQLQAEIQNLSIEISNLNKKSLKNTEQLSILKQTSFSKIFSKIKTNTRSFIYDQIQKMQNSSVISEQLIYKYDPHNKTNVHKYIDEKNNLLFIIETISGKILGAYTQDSFKPSSNGTQSFLFDVRLQKIYSLRETNRKKAIQYDPYFIVFGRDELILQHNSNKLRISQNLGGPTGYFKIHSSEADNFLHQTKRLLEVEFKSYQIYQLFFDKIKP